MARTNKNFASKRLDLVNKVWQIFLKYGYQNTTLSLIIKELNINKGVFYHYFGSKEECAEAAVTRYTDILVDKTITKCRENGFDDKDPMQKMKMLFERGSEIYQENAMALDGINAPANKVFHERLMISFTKKLSAEYTVVIREGVQKGCFYTQHPQEIAEIIIVLSNFYLDFDFFEWEAGTLPQKISAYKEFVSKALGVKPEFIF